MHRSVIAAAFAMALSATALPLAATPATAHPRPQQGPQISMIVGRIAFLKAELGITPAQEALWKPVAAAMRENAVARRHLRRDFHAARADKNLDAIARLTLREKAAEIHATSLRRFSSAFNPLYAGLSPKQKHVAYVLFGHFARHGHHPGRG